MSNFYLRVNTNVPNGKRNVAYGNSKNQGPSALGPSALPTTITEQGGSNSIPTNMENKGLECDVGGSNFQKFLKVPLCTGFFIFLGF